MRNCTIVNSALTSTSPPTAAPIRFCRSASATIQNVVIAGITNAFGALGPRGSGTNVMMRCATDTAVPINATCLAGWPFRRSFRVLAPPHDERGAHRPGRYPASYPAFDLAGKPRISRIPNRHRGL